MTTFSPTEAAFEGFRVVRRQPMIVVWWSLAYLALFVVAFLIFGQSMASLMALSEGIEASDDPSLDDLRQMGAVFSRMMLFALPLGLLAGAVLNAAVARSVLRPGEHRFGYLRLGMDELRVLVVTLVLGLLQLAVALVGSSLVGGLIGVGMSAGQPWLFLVAFLVALAAIAGFVWIAVRLSLAVPITLAERRVAIFASWPMTARAFWPLFGMAILAFVMSMVVSLLSSIVAGPASLLTGGGLEGLARFEGQSPIRMLEQAAPSLAVWAVVNAIASTLQAAVLYAPFSAAYRDLSGRSTI